MAGKGRRAGATSDQPWYRTATGLRVRLHVQPRASRDRIVGRHGQALKLQVTAPPVGGAANAAVVRLLGRVLSLPRRAVHLVRGETGREKLVDLVCDDAGEIERRLAAFAGDGIVDKSAAGD